MATGQNIDIAAPDLIAGMAKGMAVLETFDTQRQRLNATLAAEMTGLSRAAARRHLLTLAHLGYLETDGQFYWLTPKVLRFSGSYLASARLPRSVQPVVNALAAQTGLSFSCVVLEGREGVIVAHSAIRLEGRRQPIAYGLRLGSRLPAHATSTGKVLLAALGKKALKQWLQSHPLTRLTTHTITEASLFKKTIAQVQRDDYCISNQEHELGIAALAIPLRNMPGQTLAALNVVVDARRITPAQLQAEVLPLMQAQALELRQLL
ncbi:transcriptional regulator, IclR family [Lampropedia hyalina DSM 16112]|jgi:IclR family pca regulon transcriptional regulator|uniref:Transcriptional regulator, IclR family n=1 Tax=Lampropedia hyalina DSM 16112 TaxID=1122156 RepID=A0A1M4TSI8_9BURK|nr:IclR family transcriptional regulator C-terminal domain-containing protein [Lampropedia hyalina]SHE47366.1 transcriptional regulator, IclR family [Lampropedia hyalina DSM 16112]